VGNDRKPPKKPPPPFKKPPKLPGESNYSYQLRVNSARQTRNDLMSAYNREKQLADQRRLAGSNRTPAQQAADAAQKKPPKPPKKTKVTVTGPQPGVLSPQATTKKRYEMVDCRNCGGTGQKPYGIIHVKYKPCRRCSGTGKALEQIN
jgi:hypothetical protein